MTLFGWPNVSFAKVSVKLFDWTPEMAPEIYRTECFVLACCLEKVEKRIANAEIFDFDGALIDRILR